MRKLLTIILLLWATIPFIATAQNQGSGVFTIGNPSQSNSNGMVPFTNNTSSITSQQIILGSELNGPAMITGIDFYSNNTSSGHGNCTIYLANTFYSCFSSQAGGVAGWVPYGERFQLVSHETFATTPGWNHYDFDSAFFYNGLGNLVLMICAPTAPSTSCLFSVCNTLQPMSRYRTLVNTPNPTNMNASNLYQRSLMRIYTTPVPPLSALCPVPTMRFDSVGSEAIRVVRSAINLDTAWKVQCITDGEASWHSSGLLYGDTVCTLTGLIPNRNYEFRLTTFCSDTQSVVYKTVRTNCDPFAFPFAEGFESTSLPSCWTFLPKPGTTNNPVVATVHYAGSRSLHLRGGCAILPLLNEAPDSLELDFWAQVSSGPSRQIAVGMVMDELDTNSFYPLATFTLNDHEWHHFVVQTQNYPYEMGRLAIKQVSSANSNYLYIDEVQVVSTSVNPVINCAPVTGVAVDQVNDTSAVVHWNDPNSLSYQVVYGENGFDPDTATAITIVQGGSVLLSDLIPDMHYSVYVRLICHTGSAPWTTISFRTECTPMDTLPYMLDFDDFAYYTYPTSFPCWRGTVGIHTYVTNASTAVPSHTGGKLLRWEVGSGQRVTLPIIDTARYPINNLSLDFWGMQASSNYATPRLIVGVMTDPDDLSTFQTVDTVTVTNRHTMDHFYVSFEDYIGTGRYVAIRTAGGSYCDAYLDDIRLSELPPCPDIQNVRITSVSENTVTLIVDSTHNAVAWQVVVDTTANEPTQVTLPVAYSTEQTVTLLPSDSNYIWVRTICMKGDTSAWYGPIIMRPGEWNMRAHHIDTMQLCGATVFDDGGPNGMPTPSQNSTIYLLPDEPGHLVSVSGACSHPNSSVTKLEILDADGSLLWTSLSSWSPYLSFGPIISSSGPLILHYVNSPITDVTDSIRVQVDCIEDNCVIKHLRADSLVTDTSLSVSWECNGASLYEIEYGPVGFALGTGTQTTTTTHHFSIGGLHSLDRRDIYVRSICGEGDTGAWCHSTFQTLPCATAVFRDNYDSTLASIVSLHSPIGDNIVSHCYTQTLIEPSYLAGLENGITAMAIHPADVAIEDNYTHVEVYLANVSDTDFVANVGDTAFVNHFIEPDSMHHFVKVIDSANFCHGLSTDWIVMPFDHPFLWDGHSQLLVAVMQNGGVTNYHGSRAGYRAHVHNRNTQASAISASPLSIDSFDSSLYVYPTNIYADIRLYSNLCHMVPCEVPTIDSIAGNYETATLAWHGDGTDYQLSISPDPNNVGIVNITDTTYTFFNLQPATTYLISLRKDCTEDFLGYSAWVTTEFTTDSFACPPPTDLAVSGIDYESATLTWTADAACQLNIRDTLGNLWTINDAVSPYILDNLTSGCTYFVSISNYCGSASQIEGTRSELISFMTLRCLPPSNLAIANLTNHTVTFDWTSSNPCRLRLWDNYQNEWIYESVAAPYSITDLVEGTTYYAAISSNCNLHQPANIIWSDSITFLAPSCQSTTGLHVENATAHTLTVAWDTVALAQDYQLRYFPSSATFDEGTDTIVQGNRCTISNLMANTDYTIYVRTHCGDDWYADGVDSITISSTVAIEQNWCLTQYSLYPNPTSGKVVIEGPVEDILSITLYNMAGGSVLSLDNPSAFDISNLPSGSYIVRIQTIDGFKHKLKLIKK